MLKKNAELTVTIESMGMKGEGVAKECGCIIFVPFALTGEKVKIKILKVKNNIAFAKLLEVFTPADERVRPKCAAFGKCGGCQLQHLKYGSQLKLKSKMVKDCFYKIAALDLDIPMPVKSDYIYKYRNKMQMPVGADEKDSLLIGFYAENSHRIVSLNDCSIHPDWAQYVISAVRDYALRFGIKGYDEKTKSGVIRHLAVREIGGQFIIGLVVTKKIENTEYLIESLSQKLRNLSFFININTADTNIVFGNKFMHLYGPEKFEEEELGIKYYSGAETFMQVNPYIRRKLYDRVIKSCKGGIVIDAYSGGGLLSAMLAKHCEKVYGIEMVKEAADCANELAQKNDLTDKMVNIHGRVEDKLQGVITNIGGKFTLVLDPPRKGCELKVLQTALKGKPERIVYVSCNPATLARDIGLITGSLKFEGANLIKNPSYPEHKNYEIESVQPFDMFPQTKHVETVVLITRAKE